jgi:hypothetical protein
VVLNDGQSIELPEQLAQATLLAHHQRRPLSPGVCLSTTEPVLRLHLGCTTVINLACAEAGRWQDVIMHPYGSYTFQDLLQAAAYLRQHVAALHQEVRSRFNQTCQTANTCQCCL